MLLKLIYPEVPSMFGRDLIEQVRADAADDDSFVPIIVEKCIEAVEVRGRRSKCLISAHTHHVYSH